MNRNTFLLSALLSLLLPFYSSAMVRQLLNGCDWEFGQLRLENRYPAQVPGVVHLDLIANGIIDNPFVGLNERGVQWVDKEDWVYEKTFIPDKELLDNEHIEIVFNGLDTYTDIFLNDTKILNTDNMFRTWRADARPYIKEGENRLKIIIHSPIKVDMPRWEQFPDQYRASNDQSENGGMFGRKLSVFARKAGYHYGWDWGPRLVTQGIWRDVFLEGWDGLCIRNVHIRQSDVSNKKAALCDVVEIEAATDRKDVTVYIKDNETGKILAKKKSDLLKGLNKITLPFEIKNPRLWWCNGLGNPELYTFSTVVEEQGKQEHIIEKRIGLRSVEIVTDSDADGHMQFYFVLNGVPVFAKGSNYIPQDNFLPAVTREKYEKAVLDAKEANMNMLRVWGGGIYEDDLFYDLCDEHGIMVWQDFMFACSMYPATSEWLENVKLEARDNIRRLRHHPSIVLWCGGNECLDAWYNWGWKGKHEKTAPDQARRIEEEMNTLYFVVLPEMMQEHDPESFYWPNSPFSGQGKGSDGVNGDRHYYGVWQRKHPISQYNLEKSHFFSEYGVQSFPEYNTILQFAADTTTHNLKSDVMMWHQRGGNQANGLIAWYLENEYREPSDFKEMIYLNQVFQGDAMRTAIESHRRAKPYCMGSLLWQHDDCWPVASWSTRDYYGNWKAAHYMVRNAFENVIVSAEITTDSIHVYSISDLTRKSPGKLKVTLYSTEGSRLFDKEIRVSVPGNTSSRIWSGKLDDILHDADPHDVVINLCLDTEGNSHEGNFYMCRQSDLRLPSAEIEYDIQPIEGGFSIGVKSDKFVRALYLFLDGEAAHFDDNYFDLTPGIEKRCAVKTNLPIDIFKSKFRMKHLTTC